MVSLCPVSAVSRLTLLRVVIQRTPDSSSRLYKYWRLTVCQKHAVVLFDL